MWIFRAKPPPRSHLNLLFLSKWLLGTVGRCAQPLQQCFICILPVRLCWDPHALSFLHLTSAGRCVESIPQPESLLLIHHCLLEHQAHSLSYHTTPLCCTVPLCCTHRLHDQLLTRAQCAPGVSGLSRTSAEPLSNNSNNSSSTWRLLVFRVEWTAGATAGSGRNGPTPCSRYESSWGTQC